MDLLIIITVLFIPDSSYFFTIKVEKKISNPQRTKMRRENKKDAMHK